jgi:hypothetical protein
MGALRSFQNFDPNGLERKAWLQRYEEAKQACVWENDLSTLEYKYDWFPTDETMRSSYFSYLSSQQYITTYYPSLPMWLVRVLHALFKPASNGQEISTEWCKIALGKEDFRIRRFGPFKSTGGFDWHKMKLEDPYRLAGEPSVFVTGFTAMPVRNGEVLGNPPIHIHHANLGPNLGSSLSRISQWHGDSQCAEDEGGTACYATTLPAGFGFPASQPLRMDIDFNDLRPAGSEDLVFWLETAIATRKPRPAEPVQALGTVIFGVPFRMEWWKSSDFQRLYFVKPHEPSALWMTARMPTSGTFVQGKLETHQMMFDTALVFTGVSPEDLGLNQDSWVLERPWKSWLPSEHGWVDSDAAIRELKGRIRHHFEDAQQRSRQASSRAPALVWTLNRTVIEADEEREMPWPAQQWAFEQGDQVTIVIFHKALQETHGRQLGMAMKPEMPQHLAITGYYVPEEDATFSFVMGSTHADWAWINEVHWLLALTHFGGPPAGYFSWGLFFFIAICALGIRLFLQGAGAFAKKLHNLFAARKAFHSYTAVNPSDVAVGENDFGGSIGREETR